MSMLLALFILLSFQLLGEGTVRLFHLFIPGPVLGMVYFFLALLCWKPLRGFVEDLTKFITTHLALFYVPAGVGMIEYFDLFGKYGVGMVLTIILSTTITILATALIFHWVLKISGPGATRD